MSRRDASGIWEGFIPAWKNGAIYKYHICSKYNGYKWIKGTLLLSLGSAAKSASVVWDLQYEWNDQEWMSNRHKTNALSAPIQYMKSSRLMEARPWGGQQISHLQGACALSYDYVKKWIYTRRTYASTEHPFYGSWGIPDLGYFARKQIRHTAGSHVHDRPLHRNGIGVILDWVPSHSLWPSWIVQFWRHISLWTSGPRKGYHPEWKSYIFNHGRNEVRNFLISSALFWLEHYHMTDWG